VGNLRVPRLKALCSSAVCVQKAAIAVTAKVRPRSHGRTQRSQRTGTCCMAKPYPAL